MPDPVRYYKNVHDLPLEAMPHCDICYLSAVCKSLSHCSSQRRPLQDTSSSSGATMASCLQYVSSRRPPIVIIENVMGLLDSPEPARDSDCGPRRPRNIDHVLQTLREAGYFCGYAVQDACRWCMPQTRRRVYVWAQRGDVFPPGRTALSTDDVRLLTPRARFALENCLME